MTRYTVERDDLGWSVVRYANNAREELRPRWHGMSCIDAQVIAAELERAYGQGREDMREDIRLDVFPGES